MSPAVRGAGLDTWSSSRSCLRSGNPTLSLAERGAPECPRRPLGSLGLCTHARTLSRPALTASPRRAAPLLRRPATSRTRQTPSTLRAFALHPRALAADLAQSTPIAGVRGDRRRAASFNAPFSRIALPRDDTKKPSSFSAVCPTFRSRRHSAHNDPPWQPPQRGHPNQAERPGQGAGGFRGLGGSARPGL